MNWWEQAPEEKWWEQSPVEPTFWERAGKVAKIATTPQRLAWKGLGYGIGAIGWPFQRAEALVAGPLESIQESGTPLTRALGPERPTVGPVEAMKNLAKSFIPPVKALATWKMPEDTKTFGDVFRTYHRKMTGEEPEGFQRGITTAAGVGTSFLITPQVVSKAFKGITAAGKMTPWYKAWQAKQIPALSNIMLEFGADKAEAIEIARQMGKTVTKKELYPIASKLFKTTKPTKSQISAVAKRLKQIEQGGVTARPELAEKAGQFSEWWKQTQPLLEKHKLLGKETIFTKLTKARKSGLKTEVVKLQKQLNRLETAPHYVGTKEISAQFPGRAEQISKLRNQINNINLKIWRSEHLGGTLPTGEAIPLKYGPRMYQKFEEGGRRWPYYSKFRIRKPYAKHRKDISLAARKEMGEITGLGYPEVKRMMQTSSDLATAQLMESIAQKADWVDDVAREGFKHLPEGKYLGALAGKYVHPEVYNKVTAVVDVRTNPGKIYDAMAGVWKLGKTVWSSALHFRNNFSNSILNDITGTDHIAQARMAKRLIGEIKNNSDEWMTIKRYLSRSGFSEAELMDDLLNLSQGGKPTGGMALFARAIGKIKSASRVPANIYAKEEMIGKSLKYLHMREKGMAPIQAVREAQRALFDYGSLSAWERTYARRAMPFYTFPRKAIPVVLQSMRDNPYAVAKYPLMFWGMQQYSLNKLNISEKDYEELSKQLPEYMQRGSYMLLPYRDKDNKLRFFDWTYILPWGPMSEMNQRGPLDIVLSNPLYTVVADIQRNKSSFTDKKIFDDTISIDQMTPEYRRLQFFKKLKYVWQMAVPSLVPEGIYWEKLEQAAQGQRPWSETIAHTVFGLRTQAVEPKETKFWYLKGKEKQYKEVMSNIWKLQFRKKEDKITEKEYQRLYNIYQGQLRKMSGKDEEMELLLKVAK